MNTKPKLTPRDSRYAWLMAYIEQHGNVDVLNSDFVDDYIEATHAKFRPSCWGAHICPMLGSDLAHMARVGALKRFTVGLGANWQPGFPRWVWTYEVGPASYLYSQKTLNPQPPTERLRHDNDNRHSRQTAPGLSAAGVDWRRRGLSELHAP